MANNVDDVSALKAIAGERHERDHANNPDLSSSAVPSNSAAQKTDSALGHYTAALGVSNSTGASQIQGSSIPLSEEPGLADRIERQAETAEDAVQADHFAKAAVGVREAYEQDKGWLAGHPEMDQGKRS